MSTRDTSPAHPSHGLRPRRKIDYRIFKPEIMAGPEFGDSSQDVVILEKFTSNGEAKSTVKGTNNDCGNDVEIDRHDVNLNLDDDVDGVEIEGKGGTVLFPELVNSWRRRRSTGDAISNNNSRNSGGKKIQTDTQTSEYLPRTTRASAKNAATGITVIYDSEEEYVDEDGDVEMGGHRRALDRLESSVAGSPGQGLGRKKAQERPKGNRASDSPGSGRGRSRRKTVVGIEGGLGANVASDPSSDNGMNQSRSKRRKETRATSEGAFTSNNKSPEVSSPSDAVVGSRNSARVPHLTFQLKEAPERKFALPLAQLTGAWEELGPIVYAAFPMYKGLPFYILTEDGLSILECSWKFFLTDGMRFLVEFYSPEDNANQNSAGSVVEPSNRGTDNSETTNSNNKDYPSRTASPQESRTRSDQRTPSVSSSSLPPKTPKEHHKEKQKSPIKGTSTPKGNHHGHQTSILSYLNAKCGCFGFLDRTNSTANSPPATPTNGNKRRPKPITSTSLSKSTATGAALKITPLKTRIEKPSSSSVSANVNSTPSTVSSKVTKSVGRDKEEKSPSIKAGTWKTMPKNTKLGGSALPENIRNALPTAQSAKPIDVSPISPTCLFFTSESDEEDIHAEVLRASKGGSQPKGALDDSKDVDLSEVWKPREILPNTTERPTIGNGRGAGAESRPYPIRKQRMVRKPVITLYAPKEMPERGKLRVNVTVELCWVGDKRMTGSSKTANRSTFVYIHPRESCMGNKTIPLSEIEKYTTWNWDVEVGVDGMLKVLNCGSFLPTEPLDQRRKIEHLSSVEVSYLFWEARLFDYNTSSLQFRDAEFTSDSLFFVSIERLELLVSKVLSALGFPGKEIQDFVTYWTPQLLHERVWKVLFCSKEMYDRYAKLKIDTFGTTEAEIVRCFVIFQTVGDGVEVEMEGITEGSEDGKFGRKLERTVESVLGYKHSQEKDNNDVGKLKVFEWGGLLLDD